MTELGEEALEVAAVVEPDAGVSVEVDPRERRWVLIAWTVLGVAFVAAMWSRRWISDDGFINLRIVDNLLGGHGPVFNVGERVEAGTSQLWLVLLAVPQALLGWLVDAEWLAVFVGLACSAGAVVVAVATQWRTWRGPVVPVAVLAWLPLGAVWDFSSSGLEGPLLWLWTAGSFGVLAVRAVDADRRAPWRPWWSPVLLGLGPLIRPDAALYSLAFLAVLLLVSERSWRGALRALGLAVALPAAYELFRMGFFGAMVPNTALAKEAGGSDWGTGGRYLLDFLLDGWLWIPVAALAGVAVLVVRSGAVRRPLLLLWAVSWGAAVVHAAWVVRVGGDFMHARLLLGDWFLLLLPLWALPADLLRRLPVRAGAVGLAVLVVWGASAWVVARQPLHSSVADGVVDERTNYSWAAEHPHPVTIEDHGANAWTRWGIDARERAEAGRDVVLLPRTNRSMRSIPAGREGTAIVWPNIGLLGYAAGPDVHVIDPIGLSDAFAARMEALPGARVGHAKDMPLAWVEARFGRAEGATEDADLAGRALSCPALQELQNTIAAPLTPQQFARNVLRAPSLTLLSIPRNPHVAVDELC